MSYVSIFCFLAALAIVLSTIPRGADIFSPIRVFGLIWVVAIGLTDLKLSRLQHDWDPLAWVILGIGLSSFVIGVLLVRIVSLNEHHFAVSEIRAAMHRQPVEVRILFGIIVLLFSLYSISYVIEWMAYGVLPAYASSPDRARTAFGLFGVHLFVTNMPALLFLVVEYFILVRGEAVRKIALAAMFLIVFVSTFLLLNRLFYVYFLILALVFAYYATTAIKARRVVIPVAVLVGILGYLQSVREARFVRNYLYIISGMKFSETYAALAGPYMYITMNLENFARAVVRIEHQAYGYFTFDFLLALAGLKHTIADYFGLEKRMFLTSGYNTYPYLWEYYYDFGLVGAAGLSLLLGLGIGLCHRWMRQRPSVLSVTTYAALVYVMALSFFTNSLTALNFNFNFLVLIISQIILVRASKTLPEGKSLA